MLLVFLIAISACGEPARELQGTTVGVITEYLPSSEADGSITLLSDGSQLTIVVSTDTSLEFPPTHIQEHRLTSEPVSVDWIETNGVKKAVSISDG